jgi:hypothetical protein
MDSFLRRRSGKSGFIPPYRRQFSLQIDAERSLCFRPSHAGLSLRQRGGSGYVPIHLPVGGSSYLPFSTEEWHVPRIVMARALRSNYRYRWGLNYRYYFLAREGVPKYRTGYFDQKMTAFRLLPDIGKSTS